MADGGDHMILGNQIHELRKKNNLSQEQLAEKVGVARQTISKWELGETAPDIKQAQLLAQSLNVSLDNLLGNDTKESINNTQSEQKSNNSTRRKYFVVISAVICLCLAICSVFGIVKRLQILYPQGIKASINITVKEPTNIKKGDAEVIVFQEIGKPAIMCSLPDGFEAVAEISGLYTTENGNYIKFNSDYAENVINPLYGTIYQSYYERHGYHSYMDMARLAMYHNPPKLGIFSSKDELHLAGGAQIIRQQLCAGQNAEYYTIGGELNASGDKVLISGFALHFENITWLVTLKDYEDNYYYITIKDADGIGKSIDTIGDFLSNIYAGNAAQRSNALDSSALQQARSTFKEYYASCIANGNDPSGYYIFQANNSRFVAFYTDGSEAGVFYSVEDALKAMIDSPEHDKLAPTDTEGLWIYNP